VIAMNKEQQWWWWGARHQGRPMQPARIRGGDFEDGGRGVAFLAVVMLGSFAIWSWMDLSPEWLRWIAVACYAAAVWWLWPLLVAGFLLLVIVGVGVPALWSLVQLF
jgi:hypothetical protein